MYSDTQLIAKCNSHTRAITYVFIILQHMCAALKRLVERLDTAGRTGRSWEACVLGSFLGG